MTCYFIDSEQYMVVPKNKEVHTMTIQTNATDRKKLAKSIAEFTGNEIH